MVQHQLKIRKRLKKNQITGGRRQYCDCQEAKESHDHHIKCTAKSKEERKKIADPEKVANESSKELRALRHNFTLTLSVDYQMSKLIPHWISLKLNKRVHIFMDNACSTNKNCYTMAWAMEMVQ